MVAGGVAIGFGEPFLAAAREEIDDRARLDFSRGPDLVPPASAPAPTWSARARWRGGASAPRGRAPVSAAWLVPAVVAVARRPWLWPVAVRQTLRLARPGWWRRWPPLPLPDPSYLRFRLQTAYGDPERPRDAGRGGLPRMVPPFRSAALAFPPMGVPPGRRASAVTGEADR